MGADDRPGDLLPGVRGATLLWTDDRGEPRRLDLRHAPAYVTIGRRTDSGLALPWDREVSRTHAQLERIDADWTVRDDGLSRNGTFVNGERVRTRRRLADGDVLKVGTTLLTFHRAPRPDSEPTSGPQAVSTGVRATAPRIVVHLCGRLELRVGGRDRTGELSGRLGRRLFAYLVAHRGSAVRRDELADVLWPSATDRPSSPEAGLSVQLARLRRVLQEDAVIARGDVRLDFGAAVSVDVEDAGRWRDEARRLAGESPARALAAVRAAPLPRLRQRYLPEFEDEEWVRLGQGALDRLVYELLELEAIAALAVGGGELNAAEHAAGELVELDRLRESGYRLLMRAHGAMGNPGLVATVYDQLSRHLVAELGMPPSAETRALRDELVG